MPHPIGRRPLLAAAGSLLAAPALAFPDRSLRWIVAYPAGGGTDSLARLLGSAMAPGLGQTIVIDNRPGAAATLGADAAARAAPDGHTLFSADSGTMVNNIALFRTLSYDPVRNFRGVGLYCDFPLVVAVRADSPHRDIDGYLAAARREPGRIACGTPGIGSPHHLALERFQKDAGIRLTSVPYRGGAPLTTDLLAGNVESAMVDLASAGQSVRAGRLRALALTMPQRWAPFGDVPTLREAGLADYRAPAWQGIVVPSATPDAIVARLGAELARVMADSALRERMIGIGVEPMYLPGAEFDALMTGDRAYWVPLIRDLGISLEG